MTQLSDHWVDQSNRRVTGFGLKFNYHVFKLSLKLATKKNMEKIRERKRKVNKTLNYNNT